MLGKSFPRVTLAGGAAVCLGRADGYQRRAPRVADRTGQSDSCRARRTMRGRVGRLIASVSNRASIKGRASTYDPTCPPEPRQRRIRGQTTWPGSRSGTGQWMGRPWTIPRTQVHMRALVQTRRNCKHHLQPLSVIQRHRLRSKI